MRKAGRAGREMVRSQWREGRGGAWEGACTIVKERGWRLEVNEEKWGRKRGKNSMREKRKGSCDGEKSEKAEKGDGER